MMTAKQREDLRYISGWVLGMSYNTDQSTAEGLVDVSECIDCLLNEDAEEAKKMDLVQCECRVPVKVVEDEE